MCTNTNVTQPAAPNISSTAASTLQSQIDLAPQQYAAASQYAPQYQDLLNNLTNQGLFGGPNSPGLLSTYQQAAPLEQMLQSQLNSQQAGANIGLVNNLGLQATQAFQNANPQLASVNSAMTNLALNNPNPVSGPSYQNSTIDQLNSTAQQQLALGTSISPQQAATTSGQILANYDQQGRANDPMAIAGLAQGLDTYGQQLLGQRESAAGTAGGLQATSNATMTQQQQAAQQYNATYGAGLLGQAGSQLAATSVNPYAAILGQSGAIGTTGGIAGQTGAGTQLGQSQSAFDPFNIATSLYGNYQSAQSAANVGSAQNATTAQGNWMSFIGSALCWTAREVYKGDDVKWRQFRFWLIFKGPRWFLFLYAAYGERFALWIADKPRLKSLIRIWMDSRIETLEA
jgi:hypothetical protein